MTSYLFENPDNKTFIECSKDEQLLIIQAAYNLDGIETFSDGFSDWVGNEVASYCSGVKFDGVYRVKAPEPEVYTLEKLKSEIGRESYRDTTGYKSISLQSLFPLLKKLAESNGIDK